MTDLALNAPDLRFENFTEAWDYSALGELGSFKNGLNKDKADFGFGVEFVNLMDVFGKSILEDGKLDLVNATQKEIDSYNLLSGDVLFIRSSVKRTGVGETSLVPEDLEDVVYSGFLIRFREHSTTLDLKYKRYCFSIASFRKKLLSFATTSANTNINQESLEKIVLSYPSLPEQQKIAAFLSAVDKKIQQLQRKKELLEQYKKGVMQKIFSQEIRFKDEDGNDFPEWVKRRFGDIAHFYSGGTPSTTKRDYYEGNIPFIKSGEIKNTKTEQYISDDGLKSSSAKMVKKGDLLFALYGATAGESAISRIEGAINQAVLCIIPESNEVFLYQYLLFMKERLLATYLQGGQGNLSAAIIKRLTLSLPSHQEQNAIAELLENLDFKISFVREALWIARNFKKGLLQQMFV